MGSGRLLIDPPQDGARNMAVDEALMKSTAQSRVPIIRIYQWAPATVSLGYFQAWDDGRHHEASQQCPVVRRTSGGGAIVHDREVTYSVCLPDHGRSRQHSQHLYDAVHDSLIEFLADNGVPAARFKSLPAGSPASPDRSNSPPPEVSDVQPVEQPFLCFQRRAPDDLLIGETKILGSAQRRRDGALLQHGSLLCWQSDAAPELPGVADMAPEFTKRFLSLNAIGDAVSQWLSEKLGRELGIDWDRSRLSDEEQRETRSLMSGKFATDAWNKKR